MSHSVTTAHSSLTGISRRSTRTSKSKSSSQTLISNTPKRCKCYSKDPTQPCFGTAFGIDLMSRANVKRVTTAEHDVKFQKDLQQHSRRMGWGVPVKPKRKTDDGSVGSKRGKGKGKGGKAKMPILHRASSRHDKSVHPSHGTLNSSAALSKSLAAAAPSTGGGPWWENEFSSRNLTPSVPPLDPSTTKSASPAPQPLSKTDPLPPSNTTKTVDEMVGVTIGIPPPISTPGAVVAFNPHDPLPPIPSIPVVPSTEEDDYGGEDFEENEDDEDDNGPTALDDPDLPNPPIEPTSAIELVASQDPSNPSLHPPSTSQEASDMSMQEFKMSQMVDAALFASWKALPWQTRVCPMALEERESVRLLASMVSEARRIRQWTKVQNELAMDAAQREDKRFAGWLMEERRRVREIEEREEKRVREREEEEKVVVEEGERREEERVKVMEEEERVRTANWIVREFWEVKKAAEECYDASLPDPVTSTPNLDTANRLIHIKREEARFSKKIHDEGMKAALLAATERSKAQEIHESERDRVGTQDYEHARKTNAVWAAEVARATGEANGEDDEARRRWMEEKGRVEKEDVGEKGRVEAWETLQYKVMRAAMANVLRLLAPDTSVVDFEDEVEKSKYYCGAYKKRCKLQKGKFQKQRYLAEQEARSTSKRWLGALRKWRDASIDVHEKRRNYEKDRVANHMQNEVDRVNGNRTKELDRVAYAWDRECQRVMKWRDTESSLFKDLTTEWRRENTEGEKVLHETVQECAENITKAQNIVEDKLKVEEEGLKQLQDNVKEVMTKVEERGQTREREEREKVREFEGAQLLMVLGVSEQLTKIAGDSIVKFGDSTEVKEATFIAAESAVSEEIDRFAKSENTRISAAYRMETERATKRAKEEGSVLEEEWNKVEEKLKKSCDDINKHFEAFSNETNEWAEQRGDDLKAKSQKWKEEEEQVSTNELLRMFGQEGFRSGMDIEEIPKSGKRTVTLTIKKTRTVRRDPKGEEAIGKKVEVFWDSEDAWFQGTVSTFEDGYYVKYDDGDEELVDTDASNYRWMEKVECEEEYEEEIEEVVESAGIDGKATTEELHAWRVKCTLEIGKTYKVVIDKELQRQGICLKDFIKGKVESLLKLVSEGQQLAAKWLYDTIVSGKVARGEVLDNEATRVNNRSNHELKDWGDYVSATTLTVRNNLNYIHGLRSSFNEWVDSVHYKQRSDGMQVVRDLCKVCEEGLKDVDKDIHTNLGIIQNQFKLDCVEEGRKADGIVHEEADKVKAKYKKVTAEGVGEVKKLADGLTATLMQAQDEQDATVAKIKGEVETAGPRNLRKVGEGLDKATNPGDFDGTIQQVRSLADELFAKGKQEVEAFAKEGLGKLSSLKDEVKGGVDGHAEKATEKIRGALSGCGNQLDDKFATTTKLVMDSIKVSEDKVSELCKERSSSVKARVQKYELQINLSLAEDLEALKVQGNDFQAGVKACPGNCDVEEELKVINSVTNRRKEGLGELESTTKRVMAEEVNKEDVAVHKYNEEHKKDARGVWSDFGDTWNEKREKMEGGWGQLVEDKVKAIEEMKEAAEDGKLEDGMGLEEEFEHLVGEIGIGDRKAYDDVIGEVEAAKEKVEERVGARVGEVEAVKKRIEERIRDEEEIKRQAAAAAQAESASVH